jgi:hypothetical protein
LRASVTALGFGLRADVAQLVEHLHGKEGVRGSSPLVGLPANRIVADVRKAAPGVTDGYINKVLAELQSQGRIRSLGRGRSARWRRLAKA